jgi:UDP-galactopyranose mutase
VDIVVLSHLRWDFVYQRPQHLISRAARRHRVLFLEEPISGPRVGIDRSEVAPNLTVARPLLPDGIARPEAEALMATEIRDLVQNWRRDELVLWHYSAVAEPLSRDLGADVTVFDCMDELSAFNGAPPQLVERERALIARADLVFTGGHSLWEAKRPLHPSVHLFPSSVDLAHFGSGRVEQTEPAALAGIPHPRLVYAGVIDERIDMDLLGRLAAADVGEVVLIGPLAKIDEADVPAGPRVHRLGMQPYEQLPAFFAHSDVALMPFALNAATRFISPTKTPEYLAAGLPVVSSAVTDVVRGYGDLDMVAIAPDANGFIAACTDALVRPRRFAEVDERLAGMSWDATWEAMDGLIAALFAGRAEAA